MVVLVAAMRAKKGSEAELEKALKSVIPLVEQEAGTVQYSLHRSQEDQGRFLFYEKYTDKAALDFHSSTPYLKDLFGKLTGLLAEKPTIDLYEEVASIKRQ